MLTISSWRNRESPKPDPKPAAKPILKPAAKPIALAPRPAAPRAVRTPEKPAVVETPLFVPRADGDNRSARRRLAADVPSITGMSLSPQGAEATLINISESGLLAICGVRLKIGSPVKVNFQGTFTPSTVPGRVARTSVASMSASGIRYNVGIAFNAPIAFESEPPAATLQPAGDSTPADIPPTPPIVNRW